VWFLPRIRFFREDALLVKASFRPLIQAAIPFKKVGYQVGENFWLDPADYERSGHRDVILASSGMGKSYLAAVLMEAMLDKGEMLIIIDPEGENHTLAEHYPVRIVGAITPPRA
jgi:Helicase HerA, central domain